MSKINNFANIFNAVSAFANLVSTGAEAADKVGDIYDKQKKKKIERDKLRENN
jgi:hypothetical protein